MKGTVFFFLFVLAANRMNAQMIVATPKGMPMLGIVKGKVTEQGSGIAVEGAAVMAKTTDSMLISYTFTNEKGEYSLPKLPLDKSFEIFVKLNGYRDASAIMKLTFQQTMGMIKNLELVPDTNMLKEIQIRTRKSPFVVRNDTLEFDATAFKLLPHAVLEDLLRRLPGVMVDNQGGISVNGKKATKIQVDGRDFFGGNLSVAAQNLPAEIIDKVQVSPTVSSEQGFDKMHRPNLDQVTINVLLKKDQNAGFLGNSLAGYGTSERYTASAMISFLGGRQRYGIYGNAGNGNSGSGTMGITSLASGLLPAGNVSLSGMQVVTLSSSSGADNLSRSGGGGVVPIGGLNDRKNIAGNYNADIGDHVKIDGNYSYNSDKNTMEKLTDRLNFQSTGGLGYNESLMDNNKSENHMLSARIDYLVDKRSRMSFSPMLKYSPYTRQENRNALTGDGEGRLINTSAIRNYSSGRDRGFSHNFNFSKMSANEKTALTINWNISVSQKDGSLANFSKNEFFLRNNASLKDTIDQQGTAKERALKNEVALRISRSLGGQFTAAVEYNVNQQSGRLRKEVSSYDTRSGTYSAPEVAQSGQSKSSNIDHAPSMELAYHKDRLDIAVAAGIRLINQRSEFYRDTVIRLYQQQFSPKLILNYSFLDHSHFNFSYNMVSNAPSAAQLSPLADLSNPLASVIGNPSLKTSLGHNVNAMFSRFVPKKQFTINLSGGASFTKNQIIQDINYDNAGRQIQSFRNADGSSVFRLNGGFQKGYHLKELNIQPSINFLLNYKKDIGYVSSAREQTKAFQYGGSAAMNLNYREFLTVSPSANISFNQTRFLLNQRNGLDYNTQHYALNMKFSPFSRMEFETQFSFHYNSQIPKEFQRGSNVINSSLVSRFLKKEQLSLKLSIYDIFNNGVANATLITPSFIENVKSNPLKRYFLGSIQYNFKKLM